jgi:hypothetical protein
MHAHIACAWYVRSSRFSILGEETTIMHVPAAPVLETVRWAHVLGTRRLASSPLSGPASCRREREQQPSADSAGGPGAPPEARGRQAVAPRACPFPAASSSLSLISHLSSLTCIACMCSSRVIVGNGARCFLVTTRARVPVSAFPCPPGAPSLPIVG